MSAPIDEILVLSASMHESAHEQDWISVVNLEVARNALLKALFEGTDQPPPDALAALIRQVLESDRELIALGELAHGDFVVALGEMRHGRRAHAAYSETGSE